MLLSAEVVLPAISYTDRQAPGVPSRRTVHVVNVSLDPSANFDLEVKA